MKLTRTFKQTEVITQEVELTEEHVLRILEQTGVNLLMEDKLYASDVEEAWEVIEEIEEEEGTLIQREGYYGNHNFEITPLEYEVGTYRVEVIDVDGGHYI